MNKNKLRLLPINIYIAYILITMFISFWGPRVYYNYNKIIVFIYILTHLFIVYIGFYKGFHHTIKINREYKCNMQHIQKMLIRNIYISFILWIIYAIYLFIIGRFTFNIFNMGANYISYYDMYSEKKELSLFSFENIFLVISCIPQFIATVWGFLYFNTLNKRLKIVFISFICLMIICATISNGNQKTTGDIVIFLVIAIYIRTKNYSPKRKNYYKKRLIGILILCFALFSFAQYNRISSRKISFEDINSYMPEYTQFDKNHIVFKVFGESAGLGISIFTTGYLSGGYYGLSECFTLPFEWTYFVGNSVGISTIVDKTFKTNIYKKTYLGRLEKYNINGKKQWHTIFPWLASDYTFFGALIIMYFFAYLYGISWRETYYSSKTNPISYLLFILLSIMFIFVPSNNQIFHGYNYILISLFVFIYWFKKHKFYNEVNK